MERQIHLHPAGAVLLLQEFFRFHTEASARSLHGHKWVWHYSPDKSLNPETILQNPQKSTLLVNTIVERVENAKKNYPSLKRHIELDGPLFYRFGLLDGRVHSLKETANKYGVATSARMGQLLEQDLKTFRLTGRGSGRLSQFLPEDLRKMYC